MLFAVTGGEGAAELYFEKLKAIPEFRRLAGRLSDVRRRESASFLFKNRAAFLSYDTRSRLKEGEDAGSRMGAFAALFTGCRCVRP